MSTADTDRTREPGHARPAAIVIGDRPVDAADLVAVSYRTRRHNYAAARLADIGPIAGRRALDAGVVALERAAGDAGCALVIAPRAWLVPGELEPAVRRRDPVTDPPPVDVPVIAEWAPIGHQPWIETVRRSSSGAWLGRTGVALLVPRAWWPGPDTPPL